MAGCQKGRRMKVLYDYHKYGRNHPMELQCAAYGNGNLAIMMITHEEGYAEPWSTLTVNLMDGLAPDIAFVDINDNGDDILRWIEQNGFGEPTGRTRQSGYVTYPEYKFDLEKIEGRRQL